MALEAISLAVDASKLNGFDGCYSVGGSKGWRAARLPMQLKDDIS